MIINHNGNTKKENHLKVYHPNIIYGYIFPISLLIFVSSVSVCVRECVCVCVRAHVCVYI